MAPTGWIRLVATRTGRDRDEVCPFHTPHPDGVFLMNDATDIRERFVAAAGEFTQALGYGRNIGQIFAHIYFSRDPQSLDNLTESLGISKGSASMSVRQLEQWGAVKHVWIKGERKDFYEACEDFGRIMRKALIDLVGRTTESADSLLTESETWLATKKKNGRTPADMDFLADRVKKIREFRNRAHYLWNSPLIRVLFK